MELDDYFKTQAAKIKLRKLADKVAPDIKEFLPDMETKLGEPIDMEELEIQKQGGYRHQATIEIEQALEVVFNHNNFPLLRKEVKEDILRYGIGGYKEMIDGKGVIQIRKVNPRFWIYGACQNRDFSDAEFVGEYRQMSMTELKDLAGDQISDIQYQNIAKLYSSIPYNHRRVRPYVNSWQQYSSLRVEVMDIEFKSVNEDYMEQGTDKYGNTRTVRAPYGATSTNESKTILKNSYEVIYKASWIVGTDVMFDFGLCTDMKRRRSQLSKVSYSYHMFAPNMKDMRISSKVEGAIPIYNQCQIAWLKLQQAIAEARPSGVAISMGALESVSLGGGGETLTPLQVLDLYLQKGVLVYRAEDDSGRPVNFRPIEELRNGIGDQAARFFEILQANIQLLKNAMGLNELTDGSTPDPRTLTLVAQMASEGTNDALYSVIHADEQLLKSISTSLIIRIQQAFRKKAPIQGYIQALGTNTERFFKLSSDISVYEFGCIIESKPTDQQRQELMALAQTLAAQGMLELEDYYTIENTQNLKMAQLILSYKMRKRKEEQQKVAMEQQAQNGQIQIQSAQAAEQSKQQSLQIEYQLKIELAKIEGEYMLEAARIRAQSLVDVADTGAQTKILQQSMTAGQKLAEAEFGGVE